MLVRLLVREEPITPDRREIFRGTLHLPGGRISLGDADGEVLLPTHRGWNELVITVDADVPIADLAPEALRVDLVPA